MSGEDNSQTFLDRWSRRKRHHQVKASEAKVEQLVESPGDIASLGPVLDAAASPDENAPLVDGDVQVTALFEDADYPLVHAAAQSAADSEASGVDHSQAAVNTNDGPILTDADMPPIESLDASSDVSGFFNKGVSAALRKAALRQIFRQPQFNVRDGLNDYDGDYTVFEPLGDTITADMKFHTARKERDRLAAEAEAEQARLDAEAQQASEAEAEAERAATEEGAESEESPGDSGVDDDLETDTTTDDKILDDNGVEKPQAAEEQQPLLAVASEPNSAETNEPSGVMTFEKHV